MIIGKLALDMVFDCLLSIPSLIFFSSVLLCVLFLYFNRHFTIFINFLIIFFTLLKVTDLVIIVSSLIIII